MKNTIKIWPNLDDISQALIPYSDSRLNPRRTIFIDFSNVQHATSAGLALTIVKLLKIVKRYPDATWSVLEPENDLVKTLLANVGFYAILNKNMYNKDLWWQINSNAPIIPNQYKNQQKHLITSYPLYYLNYDREHYRETVEDFTDFILEQLVPLTAVYQLKLNILGKALKEIAKNSEDHTSDNAFFGMDLVESQHSDHAILIFSFCDLGIGIHENIKSFISSTTQDGKKDASKKFGIVDSYHKAFTVGYSTLANNKNKGIGMSMILDCCKVLGLELSVFDARSRGFIPENDTHSEIRRNFWDTGNPVGFYYYGKLHILRKDETV